MAIRQKTIDYAWDTNVAGLAAATNFDFTAKTLDIPETSSRTFRSCRLVITCRGTETVATSMTSVTVALNIAAGAFTNIISVTDTIVNSGEQQSFVFVGDATSWFTSNFSGASGSVGVRVNFGGLGTISITAEIQISYDFDDASLTTVVETLRIPLDSATTLLTATLSSIGTNQVPQLTSSGGILDGLQTVSIKQIYFITESPECAGATTNFNLALALDGEAEVSRGTLGQALNTSCRQYDIWNRDALDPTVAHDFKARTTTASRCGTISILMKVTFTYDVSSGSNTKCIQSLMFPFDVKDALIQGTVAGDQNVIRIRIAIPEPGTITLLQSGIKFAMSADSAQTLQLACGSQTDRAYTISGQTSPGSLFQITHRIDSGGASGAGITLARGYVDFTVEYRLGTNGEAVFSGGVLYLNYSSGIPSNGRYLANTVIMQPVLAYAADALLRESSALAFNVAPTEFYVNAIGCILSLIVGPVNIPVFVGVEIVSGEGTLAKGDGWEEIGPYNSTMATENHCAEVHLRPPDRYQRWNGDPDTTRMAIETTRKYRVGHISESTVFIYCGLWLYMTYHSITFSDARTVGGYGGSGSGLTVNMHRVSNHELVRQFTTGASGAYTSIFYDDTESYYETCREDSTHVGRSENFTLT